MHEHVKYSNTWLLVFNNQVKIQWLKTKTNTSGSTLLYPIKFNSWFSIVGSINTAKNINCDVIKFWNCTLTQFQTIATNGREYFSNYAFYICVGV